MNAAALTRLSGIVAVESVAMTYEAADTEEVPSLSVRRDITELISSLYGIGSNRVEILRLR